MRVACLFAVLTFSGALWAQHIGGSSPAEIERGSRLYGLHCSPCHGSDGSLVAGTDLRRGQFKRGSADEDLIRTITAGIPGTAMPGNKFTDTEMSVLVAYLRSIGGSTRPLVAGNAERGRLLFEAKTSGCTSCHRVNGKGSRTGPDLSDIGAIRSSDALERALVDPAGSRLAQHRLVRAVTKDGRVINGRRLNEDTFTVQMIDDQERLVSLSKADLREYAPAKTSAMPSYKDKLSAQESADLVAYLASLRVVGR